MYIFVIDRICCNFQVFLGECDCIFNFYIMFGIYWNIYLVIFKLSIFFYIFCWVDLVDGE